MAEVIMHTTDETRARIFAKDYHTYSPAGNDAVANALLARLERPFKMTDERLDRWSDLVEQIADIAYNAARTEGCGDSEVRDAIADVLNELLFD